MATHKKRSGKNSPRRREDPRLLKQRILSWFNSNENSPVKVHELRQLLFVPSGDKDFFKQTVNDLVEEGIVEKNKRREICLTQTGESITGMISFTRSGSAFVVDRESGKSVFIPTAGTGKALHGDKVQVTLGSKAGRAGGGPLAEGMVTDVIERRMVTVVGILAKRKGHWLADPMLSTVNRPVRVPDPCGANIGDRVLIKLLDVEPGANELCGEITDVIGPADNPALDTISVMKAFNLEEAFPADVIRQAEKFKLTEKMMEGRTDLRKKFVFTIDPDTAKDFDDAISLEKTRSGYWRLGVHIADVSAYVTPDSALDVEGFKRATSVYLPDKVIPMLPEQLSNGLCSLKPNVDRLAFSVIVSLNDKAEVQRVSFHRTVIQSKLRLTYKEAMKIIDLPEGGKLKDQRITPSVVKTVKQVHRLAQIMRRRRKSQGSLLMSIPEVKFKIGKDGRIADVIPVKDDPSHQLIEECMLLANELVCKRLSNANITQMHRIHAAPDPENLTKLETMFQLAGIRTEDFLNQKNLAATLDKVKDHPAARAWFTNVLRSMKRAEYSTDPSVGHYGLAKEHYAHFTSPIRRYPDLVTHRLLKALLAGEKMPYKAARTKEMAEHCSERERIADEAEREITDLKKMRFFNEQLESGDLREYEAVVTDIKNMGLMIDLPEIQTSGLVHVSALGDDYYEFDQAKMVMRGRRRGSSFKLGDTMKVIISRIDMQKRFLDFAPVADSTKKNGSKQGKPTRKRRRKKKS